MPRFWWLDKRSYDFDRFAESIKKIIWSYVIRSYSKVMWIWNASHIGEWRKSIVAWILHNASFHDKPLSIFKSLKHHWTYRHSRYRYSNHTSIRNPPRNRKNSQRFKTGKPYDNEQKRKSKDGSDRLRLRY